MLQEYRHARRCPVLAGNPARLGKSDLRAAGQGRDIDLVREDRRRLADPGFLLLRGLLRRVLLVHEFLRPGCTVNGGETLWEPWIDGFERAMRLRPDAWEEIALSDDEEASASISMIVALNDFYYGRSELTEEAEDELDRLAPGMIPEFVHNLNACIKSRQIGKRGRGGAGFHTPSVHDDPPAFGRKVGRNEPCQCGSGRKYKRCCGAN